MGFKPIDWYCQPEANGVWAKPVSAFGSYTPCAMDSTVICISHLVLFGLCCYRVWMIKQNLKVRRFRLRSNYYNYLLGLLAGYSTAEPLLSLVMGLSLFNPSGFAPFEIISSFIEALAWCSMLILIGLETKIYIREFRWYIRFGVLYVLVGDAVVLDLIHGVTDSYSRSSLYLYTVCCQVLFGTLLLFYVPNLDPYPGYVVLQCESLDNAEYEALPEQNQIFPERHVNIVSRIYFGWMTPLMQLGYRKPITETDVWKLDTWDQTETLIKRFQECWFEESQRSKPWLLRALNCSFGRRFWLGGGFFKICHDLSQFLGPILLNHLLQTCIYRLQQCL